MTATVVAKASGIAPGQMRIVEAGGARIALCNVGGAFYAIEDVCTHDDGPLGEGTLDGKEVECPRHGARFDVTTGAAVQLPAFEPVETHEVRLEGDTIQVGVEHR